MISVPTDGASVNWRVYPARLAQGSGHLVVRTHAVGLLTYTELIHEALCDLRVKPILRLKLLIINLNSVILEGELFATFLT
jgi:hypothetical protein